VRNALEPLQVAADNISVDVATKKVTVRVVKDFDSQKIIDVLKEQYPQIKEVQGSGVGGQGSG